MSLISLILWLVIGGLAGFVAGNVMMAKRSYGLIGSFVTAFIGAVVLIWAARKLG